MLLSGAAKSASFTGLGEQKQDLVCPSDQVTLGYAIWPRFPPVAPNLKGNETLSRSNGTILWRL